MIIWLASYPRSGNTLMRIFLHHFWNITVHSIYAEEELARHSALDPILGYPERNIDLDAMKASDQLFYVKTHELPSDNSPALYIVRDGRDALVSYTHYKYNIVLAQQKPIPPMDFIVTLRDFIVNRDYFGGWSAHCHAWTKRQAPTAIIQFEKILKTASPDQIIRAKLRQIDMDPGQPSHGDTPPTFENLNQIAPDSFRKGKKAGWISAMPEDLHQLFWRHHGWMMKQLGYQESMAAIIAADEGNDGRHDHFHEIITALRRELGRLYSNLAKDQLELDGLHSELATLKNSTKKQISMLHEQLDGLHSELATLRKNDILLTAYQKELIAKEEVIQALAAIHKRPFVYLLKHLVRLVVPNLAYIRFSRFLRRTKSLPKLEQFHQYAPKQLSLPRRYYKPPVPSNRSLPTISIVTPSLNQGDYIGHAIKSVLSQSYPNLQYCIQDGGSLDNTLETIGEYASQLSCFKSEPDSGQSNALNKGFAKCNGDIMAWLNADDILLPGAAHYVSKFFINHPNIDVVYGHRINIDRDGNEIGRRIMPRHNGEVLQLVDYIPQETLFWRRRIWQKTGGYIDEAFQFAMDWELLLRFQAHGARFKRLSRFLGAFRVHNKQKTQSWDLVGREEVHRLRRKYLNESFTDVQIHNKIQAYLKASERYYRFHRWGLLKS